MLGVNDEPSPSTSGVCEVAYHCLNRPQRGIAHFCHRTLLLRAIEISCTGYPATIERPHFTISITMTRVCL